MASMKGHEEVVRLLLQSGAQDLPNKVEATHRTESKDVYSIGLHACRCMRERLWYC